MISEPWHSIVNGRQDGLEEGELRVQAEEEEHDEEEDRPQRWNREPGESLWVRHERQT